MRQPAGTRAVALAFGSLVATLSISGCAPLTRPGFNTLDAAHERLVPITPALVLAQRAHGAGPVPDDVARLFAPPRPYTIAPSDVLSIVVYDHPELLPNAGAVIAQSADPTGISAAPGNEALGEASGPNLTTANTRQVYVVREDATQDTPTVFHLDAGSPTAFAVAEGFRLRPRDVVYVDAVPLARWNRIVSLVLPTAQAVTGVRQAVSP